MSSNDSTSLSTEDSDEIPSLEQLLERASRIHKSLSLEAKDSWVLNFPSNGADAPRVSTRRSYAYPEPGNWDSILFYRRSVGIGDTDDDDKSICPSELDIRSAAPSEADEIDPQESEVGHEYPYEENEHQDFDEEQESSEEESELEEEDAPLQLREVSPPRSAGLTSFTRRDALSMVWGLRSGKATKSSHLAAQIREEQSDNESSDPGVLSDSEAAISSGADDTVASASASTSVGGNHPAGGKKLNNLSHGSGSAESRDVAAKSSSAAKGKGKAVQAKNRRKAPRAKYSGSSTARRNLGTPLQKGANGYAEPIEIFRCLLSGAQRTVFDINFFPANEAVSIAGKKYTCQVRGRIMTEGRALWVDTDREPCGKLSATGDEARGSDKLRERIQIRINAHEDAEAELEVEGVGRKRKLDDVDAVDEQTDGHQPKRFKAGGSSSK